MKDKSNYNWISKELIAQADFSFLNQGSFIWVINWLKTPPHLGFSIDGRYFSVTINESQLDKPIDSLLRLFLAKQKPVFFAELSSKLLFELNELNNCFSISLSDSVTCLEPINKLIFNDEKAFDTIAEVLTELGELNLIKAIHVPSYEKNSWVGIKAYGKTDVISYIDHRIKEHAPSV